MHASCSCYGSRQENLGYAEKRHNIQQYSPDNSLKSFDASGSEYTANKKSSMEGREVYFKLNFKKASNELQKMGQAEMVASEKQYDLQL